MVEVIIKMPEEMYKWVNNANKNLDDYNASDFWELIKNGVLLSKGHEKIVDVNKVISDGINKGFCDWYDELKNADAIIEADKNEPLYKKGDIVLTIQGNLVFVVKDTGIDLVVVNNKDALENESRIWKNVTKYSEIERKIGNIYNEPMQVELEGDGYADGKLVYDYGICPECGWTFEEDDKDWGEPFCCHCGQRLKWFEADLESEE